MLLHVASQVNVLFLLSAVTAMTMLPLPPSGVMYSDTACQKDYLVIVGGSQTGFGPVSMFFAKDRYCGITLGKAP